MELKYCIDFDKFGLSNELHKTEGIIGDIVAMVYGSTGDLPFLDIADNGFIKGYKNSEEYYERESLFKLLFELRDINRMLFGVTRTRPTREEIEKSKQRKDEVFNELRKRLKGYPIAFATPTEIMWGEIDEHRDDGKQDECVNIEGLRVPLSEYNGNEYDYPQSSNLDLLIERGVDEGIVKEDEKTAFKAFADVWWNNTMYCRNLELSMCRIKGKDGKVRFRYNIEVLRICYAEWKNRKKTRIKNTTKQQDDKTDFSKMRSYSPKVTIPYEELYNYLIGSVIKNIDFETFKNCIEHGNIKTMYNSGKRAKIKRVMFFLKYEFDKDWYESICESCGLDKSKMSKATMTDRLKFDSGIQSILKAKK